MILLYKTQDQQLEMQELPREERLPGSRPPAAASHATLSWVMRQLMRSRRTPREEQKKDATAARGKLQTRNECARKGHCHKLGIKPGNSGIFRSKIVADAFKVAS